MNWINLANLPRVAYTCGHCNKHVASTSGWYSETTQVRLWIYVCSCDKPTYFEGDKQIPGIAPGADVEHLPPDIAALYDEARRCNTIPAHTASVLACRKLLMHVAVSQGAAAGESFVSYISQLAKGGFVPPGGEEWVDHIRRKSNEANHEIVLMTKADAEELIAFAEMLLKFIYEFPKRLPAKR